MNIKLTGEITYIHPIVTKGRYRSRKVGITTKTNQYGFKAEYNKCYVLDEFHKGDTVTIHAEMNGKMYNGSFINNVIINDVEMIDDKGTQQHLQDQKKLKELRRNPRPITRFNLHEKNEE